MKVFVEEGNQSQIRNQNQSINILSPTPSRTPQKEINVWRGEFLPFLKNWSIEMQSEGVSAELKSTQIEFSYFPIH